MLPCCASRGSLVPTVGLPLANVTTAKQKPFDIADKPQYSSKTSQLKEKRGSWLSHLDSEVEDAACPEPALFVACTSVRWPLANAALATGSTTH
jgi:hypothetical protein